MKKRSIVIFVLLFLLMFKVFGQLNNNAESLLQQLYEEKDVRKKVDILTRLARVYRYDDPDSSLLLAQQGLELAKANGYEDGIRKSYSRLGSTNYYLGKYPLAFEYHSAALKVAQDMDDRPGMASILNNIARIYRRQGNNEKALELFISSLKLYEEFNDLDGVATSANNIALIFDNMDDDSVALEYFNRSLQISLGLGDSSSVSLVYNNIGELHQENGDFKTAQEYYIKAFNIIQHINNNKRLASSYRNIGSVHEHQGNYDEALRFYNLALSIHQEMNIAVYSADDILSISSLYQKLGVNEKGISYANRALELGKEIGSQKLIVESAYLLADIYEQLHSSDSALSYYKMAKLAEDSLFNIEKYNAIEILQANYELDKKEMEIESLNKDNLIQQAKIREQLLLRNLFIGGFFMLLVVVSLLWRITLSRRKRNIALRQKNEEISEIVAELKALNEKLAVQNESINNQNITLSEYDKERNKLFSIISHDFRGPLVSLQAVLYIINEGGLSQEEQKELLLKIGENVKVTTDFLDNLLVWSKSQMAASELKTTTIDLYEILMDCLKLLKIQAEKKEITFEYDLNSATNYVVADAEMIKIVLRNLMSNAMKFSPEGGKISIRVAENENNLTLSVQDTGVGIEPEAQDKIFSMENYSTSGTANEKGTGLGLMLCKDFIEKNGGNLWFESAIGEGSMFYFSLPKDH